MQFIRGLIQNDRNEVTGLVEGIRLDAFGGAGRRVTYYVRPGGNDSNSGLGPEPMNAFETFERAIESIPIFVHEETYIVDVTGMGTMTKSGGWFFPPFVNQDNTSLNFTPGFIGFIQEAPIIITATPTTYDTLTAGDITSQTTDATTGLRTFNTTKSYALNELKGKFAVGASLGQIAPIASNTAGPASSLEIAATFAFTAPILIVDPSAELRNSNAASSDGAVNLNSIQSTICFQGIKFSHASASATTSAIKSDGYTRSYLLRVCDITGINSAGANRTSQPSIVGCRFQPSKSIQLSGGAPVFSSVFFETLAMDFRSAGGGFDACFLAQAIIRGCGAVGNSSISVVENSNVIVSNTLIESSTSNGLIVNPHTAWQVTSTAIAGSALSGVRMNGGRATLTTVRSVGRAANTSFGLEVLDGAHCTINSTVDMVGTAGDLKVGSNAAVAWAVFHAGAPPITAVDATVQLARVVQP